MQGHFRCTWNQDTRTSLPIWGNSSENHFSPLLHPLQIWKFPLWPFFRLELWKSKHIPLRSGYFSWSERDNGEMRATGQRFAACLSHFLYWGSKLQGETLDQDRRSSSLVAWPSSRTEDRAQTQKATMTPVHIAGRSTQTFPVTELLHLASRPCPSRP